VQSLVGLNSVFRLLARCGRGARDSRVGSASTELRQETDIHYGACLVETGTAESDEGERAGFRDFTVTVRMGESGRGLLLAI
jgi:hypothetical protein